MSLVCIYNVANSRNKEKNIEQECVSNPLTGSVSPISSFKSCESSHAFQCINSCVFYLPDSGRECWCFGSNGLQALGQKELVFLLECLPQEKTLPKDLFTIYLSIFQDAQKGNTCLQPAFATFNNYTFSL